MQKLEMCHINYPGEEGGDRECQPPPRKFFFCLCPWSEASSRWCGNRHLLQYVSVPNPKKLRPMHSTSRAVRSSVHIVWQLFTKTWRYLRFSLLITGRMPARPAGHRPIFQFTRGYFEVSLHPEWETRTLQW